MSEADRKGRIEDESKDFNLRNWIVHQQLRLIYIVSGADLKGEDQELR